MSGQIDLRLSETDLENPQSVVTILNSWMDTDIHSRQERVKAWSEAINFFAGNQWIQYNDTSHRFEPIPVTPANRSIDKPVTNHLFRWINAAAARFTNRPIIIIDPNSEEMSDKTTAKICEVVNAYLWEELAKGDQYYEAALWGLICGTAFRKSYKKFTGRTIPSPAGGEEVPLRCVDTDIIPPFQMVFDGLPARWRDIGTVMQTQVRRVDDIKSQFEVDAIGYFPEAASELKPESIVGNALSYNEGLKNIVDGAGVANAGTGSVGEIKDSAIYKEVYVRPSSKHPSGLMICAAHDKLLYFGPSPYFYQEGKVWHPYTSWVWSMLPGSIWGISMAGQLLKLNRRLNTIDALVAYNRKTMAVGVWFTAKGHNIPEGALLGKPGQNVQYDEVPSGAKPYRADGRPLPSQVVQERDMILRDGDKIALAGDIRSGENPTGVNTLGQLQILTEQADLTQSKTIESWEKFIERSEELDLLNFKDCYQTPDPQMVKRFKKYSKDITQSDWDSFQGNQIQDNASIRVEKGSTVSRSRILYQAMILKLYREGLLPDIVADPYQYKKLLETFGMSDLYKDSNMDVKYAEKSIEMMLIGKYPPVIPTVHNADIQLPVILRYMKDPKFLELQPDIQALFFKRNSELVAALVAAGPVAPPMQPERPAPRPGASGGIFEKELI